MMDEKPHILILGCHSKRGKHVFNFDKYIVHFKYQVNSDGIIIELCPPVKKKQIDYTHYVSPYEGAKPPKPPSAVKKKKAQKSKKENREKAEKPNKKCSKNKSLALKKCAVQQVFNFSETPNNFPYEGCSQAKSYSQQMMYRANVLQYRACRAALQSRDISPGIEMTMARNSEPGFYSESNYNLKDSISGPQIRPEHSNHSIHKNYSMTAVQGKLEKMQNKKIRRANRKIL